VARTLDADALINVQGDEPETDPEDLDRLADAIRQRDAAIATLAAPIADPATYADPNAVKVVVDGAGRALYFSRAPIPWAGDAEAALATGAIRKHVGIYAFTKAALLEFAALPQPAIETLERLEQLRALWHGMPIRVLDTDHDPVGIDTEEDYRRFVARTMAGTRGTKRR
jgi:3-deoxy-manno-octulosonate cytidylyltransferase (CMP-KDO synthetase)